MAEITRDELLKLISVKQANDGGWRVDAVRGDVSSNVMGNVEGYVRGSVGGTRHDNRQFFSLLDSGLNN